MGLNLQGGFEALANSASGLLAKGIEEDAKIASEERSNNRQLAMEERLIAARETAAERAAERAEKYRQSGRKSDFEFDTNPENQKIKTDLEIARGKAVGTAKTDMEIEESKRKMADPGYLSARKQAIELEADTPQFRETMRHNKALEAAAFARTGAEKLSPAAKAQLAMADAKVGAAQQAYSAAAKSLDAAQKSMDPEQIKDARSEYKAAERRVSSTFDQYNEVGAKHFGGEWKVIGSPGVGPTEPFDPNNFKSKAGATTPGATMPVAPAPRPSPRADQLPPGISKANNGNLVVDGVSGSFRSLPEAIAAQRRITKTSYDNGPLRG